MTFWEFASNLHPFVQVIFGLFAMISICVPAIAIGEALGKRRAEK